MRLARSLPLATVLLATVPASTIFFAAAARPCSIAPPSLNGPIAPADGASGVPTNARVVIAFEAFAGAPNVTSLTLTGDDGSSANPPFGVDGELVVVRPTSLSPTVRYTLSASTDDFGIADTTTRTFTTGTSDDTTAPVLDDALTEPSYTFEPKAAFGQGFDSCGFNSVDRYFVELALPRASDDVALAGYALFTVDENGGRVLRATILDAEADTHVIEFTEPGTYTFQVDAFDLAGNATSSNEVTTVLLAPLVSCSAMHATTSDTPPALVACLAIVVVTVRRRRAARA